jgi:hypothetical protein
MTLTWLAWLALGVVLLAAGLFWPRSGLLAQARRVRRLRRRSLHEDALGLVDEN